MTDDFFIADLAEECAIRREKAERLKAFREGRPDKLVPGSRDSSVFELTMDGVLKGWSSRERK